MRTSPRLLMVALAAGFAAFAAAGNAQSFAGAESDCPGAYGAGPGMMGWGGGPGTMGWGGGPRMGPRGGYGPQMGPGAMGPRGGFGPGVNAESNAEARLAYLKTELKITADQEAAWQAYGASMKQQATQMQAFRTAMFSTQTAQERVALHAEHAKQRAAGFEALDKSLRDLYAVLTADQKATADLYLGRMRFGQAGPRGRWH
jgi:LTXXQ motif family protein